MDRRGSLGAEAGGEKEEEVVRAESSKDSASAVAEIPAGASAHDRRISFSDPAIRGAPCPAGKAIRFP